MNSTKYMVGIIGIYWNCIVFFFFFSGLYICDQCDQFNYENNISIFVKFIYKSIKFQIFLSSTHYSVTLLLMFHLSMYYNSIWFENISNYCYLNRLIGFS